MSVESHPEVTLPLNVAMKDKPMWKHLRGIQSQDLKITTSNAMTMKPSSTLGC